jgi:hypothetical protein
MADIETGYYQIIPAAQGETDNLVADVQWADGRVVQYPCADHNATNQHFHITKNDDGTVSLVSLGENKGKGNVYTIGGDWICCGSDYGATRYSFQSVGSEFKFSDARVSGKCWTTSSRSSGGTITLQKDVDSPHQRFKLKKVAPAPHVRPNCHWGSFGTPDTTWWRDFTILLPQGPFELPSGTRLRVANPSEWKNTYFYISGGYAEGGQVWKTIGLGWSFNLYDKNYWDAEGGWFWMKNGGKDVSGVNGPFPRHEGMWHSFQYELPGGIASPPSRAKYNDVVTECHKETEYQGGIFW